MCAILLNTVQYPLSRPLSFPFFLYLLFIHTSVSSNWLDMEGGIRSGNENVKGSGGVFHSVYYYRLHFN